MTRLVIAVGLVVASGAGVAASLLLSDGWREAGWYVSSVGLITACGLLTARAAAQGRGTLATGFGLLALAEAVMSAGGLSTDPGSPSAFAHGVGLYVPALLLVASSDGTPRWGRAAAVASALAFAVHALQFLIGRDPGNLGTAVLAGYTLLSVTFASWIVSLYRPASSRSRAPAASRVGE